MIRCLLIYLVVIFVMRLMGKRQIGEMEPYELVITLILADLAVIPMSEQTIPIWYGVVPLLVIAIIHFVVTVGTKTSPKIRDIVSGRPVVVIDPNGIVFSELKKLNISCEELVEQLRNLDFFDLTEVNYAIIERNGKITVIPKAGSVPVSRNDMQVVKPENEMFYCVVENGKVLKHNFKEMGLNQEAVMKDILNGASGHAKDLAFCSLSEGGDVYTQKRGEMCQNFKIKLIEKHYLPAELKSKRELGQAVG